ncbi:plus-3-domain-containing protein [Cucurbitaria berberidis CBS 394.84]|uniref:Plus-3-domain-containing protein n=1 Tax=Cucurbitaria berberidis CBS 394.84 TaxID=1168544 RepID=A0A9P4GG23_9PLEO|nr:plus-3-domain-containing protein [Cucurbitaria berberidis CBS 394.84]KAF1845418.1 plus-3-domain-containing protein [Cucurbitaria berberidis CBS 394.84]
MSMSQLEREEILGQRAEEMSKANFQAELARRAAMQNDRKRKADSEDPDDAMRKSSRPKVQPRKNEKLEAYKREREQRGQQRQRQDDRRNGRRRSSSADRDGPSDLDADGDSDVEWDDRVPEKAREELPATLRDFESVRVGRGFFSEVCFYPGFEEAMTGTFGRVGVGQDAQRRTLYKMAQIKGFSTGKPYVFEGKNGQRIATDQYVVAQHGSVKKDYQFQFLSNQRFLETDLDIYRQSLSETNAKVPTQSFLQRKYDDLKALQNHYWTDADISARIAKSKKYSHLLHRSNSDAQPKIATQSETAAAQIAELNRKNRILEAERVRKAQLDQQRQKKFEQKKEAARRKAEEEAKKAQAEAMLNKNNLDVDALFDGDGSSRASTPKPQEKKKTERKGLPTFRKPKMDDDIIASMDMGVDIEI